MFNKHTLKQSLLKKQTLAILSILVVGCFGIVYASGTTITDSSITTPNLTVTGTCTGCGSSESTFSNYNTIALNTTVFSIGDTGFQSIKISNSGTVSSQGNANNGLVALNGTVIFIKSSDGASGTQQIDQSSNTGRYKILLDESGLGIPNVFNNNTFMQIIGINQAQFSGGSLSGIAGAVAISPDGHYIVIIGKDVGGTSDRLLIFRGS